MTYTKRTNQSNKLIISFRYFDFSEFLQVLLGDFPHLGDFEGYDRKNRDADLLVRLFLMDAEL